MQSSISVLGTMPTIKLVLKKYVFWGINASNSVVLQDSNSNFALFQPMELLGQTMLYQRLLGCRGETWGLRCISQSLFVS